MMPVSTSPVPAVASAAAPSADDEDTAPGAATSVSAPFSRTTQPKRSTAALHRREPVRVDHARLAPEQPRELARVRRQHGRRRPARTARARTARRRRRPRAGRSRPAAAGRAPSAPSLAPEPRPDARAAFALAGRVEHVVERPLHRLEHERLEHRQRLRRRRDRDVARVRAKRGSRGERRRAGHPARAADDEHGAGRVLVVARATARDELRGSPRVTSRCSVSAGSSPMSATTTSPAWKRPGATSSADLRAVDRDGDVACTAAPGDLAGRRVDAGRQVDRDDRHAGALIGSISARRLLARGSPWKPGAEQRVDHARRRRALRRRASRPAARSTSSAIRPSPPFAPPPQTARSAARRGIGASASSATAVPARCHQRVARRGLPRPRASPPRCRAAQASAIGGDRDRCASSRECVIDSSIAPAPRRARPSAASRPERRTAGFGRPAISISRQVKAGDARSRAPCRPPPCRRTGRRSSAPGSAASRSRRARPR